ncbi:propionate kinase [candidate division WOR-1 bacterium RIFOXYA12_FULL_52_29]|uniref:Acetate kinase n=1 Tax=candidate division WOR-1 bacterium RIFOXYC12_FULL_54_18 TaxID=1802584 RepID=A0A1F4T6X6_UNCSA|nr:MAG: propionate kinase [candidate division WOR-1 bacterium RIFOXYA2_FULL_51_19]OGC17903.1 MAG: propionate kinase [candidate division WOR-1 bacterium RIFOXYA12_FULL_52_29]OGC26759.1 MAG: propionate kinase [candidate division WOR-1 bacterium RIFOXYB2_FULL_45_9]OGC28320.1 MAG: propionate kinase [candidate division WOR-1 bacterium RIFOXYC12_FULL_54_18]OGC31224.1 MAG: propionate kinase [candidate division WOR-1 bacterium RIFOXYB12_FULL_52_16]
MIILALNCGSSSVKFKLYKSGERKSLTSGEVERIGISGSFLSFAISGKEVKKEFECHDHRAALKSIIEVLTDRQYGILGDLSQIAAVGHRVVHGGEKFKSSVMINNEVLAAIKEVQDLAPLHNPPNIMGIEAAKEVLPDIPHVAVFDTAFHQTMPEQAYLYAVPYEWYGMYGVRRYGFHGTSHLYVSRRAAALLGKTPLEANLITMHIGNGVSAAAIKGGISVDTTMGLTPLEGAVMGTRCGDLDPSIILFMIEKEGFYVEELEKILNKKSGLLGITGKFMDRRDVDKAADDGDHRAKLAQQIEAYRLRKYIGAYSAALGRVDAIVFTAGGGERNIRLRERVLSGLENIGIVLDAKRNAAANTREKESLITTDDSPVKVYVIPTDEELVFIEDVIAILEGRYETHTHFTYSFEDPKYKRKAE